MTFFVLTLFPDLIQKFADTSIIKKGIEKNKYRVVVKDIRDHAINRYNKVDDEVYGGGAGMLIRPEPVYDAFKSIDEDSLNNRKVVYFSPKGKILDHKYIIDLTNFENIVLICGHYEGVDQRVIDLIVDEQVSIGDFVLTGGEIPAMALIDGVARQLDGVINQASLSDESFSNGLLEYRQYTRPYEFMGIKVPEVLVSGHHENIKNYKREDSINETKKYRPDLFK